METTTDLKALAREWVERGRSLAGEGVELEIFVQEHRGLTVKAFGGEVEGLRYSHSRGAGVRALRGGRLGYSYCTGLAWEDIRKAIEEAAANSRFSTPDEHNLLPGRGEYTGEDLGISDPEVEATDSARKGMSFISGITGRRALAAPVDVRMMLFMMLRLLRRSLLPASGRRSSTSWVLVAACTVAMEADMIRLAPKASMSGRIM